MNFVKLYIGDYQRDTGHLSIAEHGAYLLMLQHYYATEKPLPIGKALHRLLRAESKADRDAVDSVAAQFWKSQDGGLINERAVEEIQKAEHQRTVNREVGKKGGNPYLKEQYDEPGTLYAARLPDGRIKVGITAGPWSKRAYGLAKVYGGRPKPLALVEVEHMGRAEAEVLAEFSQFADGEVLTLPDDKEANLLANLLAKGVAKTTEVRHPNREAITSPNQTPDTRQKEKDSPASPGAELWYHAIAMLRDQGASQTAARSFIGLQCRDYDEETVAEAFSAAAGAASVKAYVSKYLKGKPRKGERPVGVEFRNGQATIGGFVA